MNEQTYREHLNDLQLENEALRAQLKASQTGDTISRKAAIKAVEDLPNCYNGYSDTCDKACIIGVLEELPSTQPEIVRCKDCIWWKDEDCTNPVGMFLSEEDDFCSCATRRNEDG